MATKDDIDAQETAEWLASIDAVIEHAGEERAHYLIEQIITLLLLYFKANTILTLYIEDFAVASVPCIT